MPIDIVTLCMQQILTFETEKTQRWHVMFIPDFSLTVNHCLNQIPFLLKSF